MNFPRLMGLASGYAEARLVQAAVELAIFDALAAAPLTADDLAGRLNLEPKATELVLNALTALTLLDKQAVYFSLSDLAAKYLVKSSRYYVGAMIRFDASLWSCWEKLPQAIRTGQPVRPPNMYQDVAAETEIFIDAMDSLVKARGDTQVVASVLDWNAVNELLDVGSGPATYPIALCQQFPKLSVTIFDLPATLKITERYVRQAGLDGRIRLIAGDYRHDPIPGEYDLIFLSNVIHGEGLESNQSLIGKLYANLRAGGRIIIKDHILDESRANPSVGAIFSLLMLLTTSGGRCYSYKEIQGWMEQAGLSKIEQIDLPSPLTSSLVIGTR
jgi:hypothetical protein